MEKLKEESYEGKRKKRKTLNPRIPESTYTPKPWGGPRLDRFNKSLCTQFQFELDFRH
jgi:hypothetical protein